MNGFSPRLVYRQYEITESFIGVKKYIMGGGTIIPMEHKERAGIYSEGGWNYDTPISSRTVFPAIIWPSLRIVRTET